MLKPPPAFIRWFRHSSPYIEAHQDRVFVIVFDGEVVNDDNFDNLIQDIALLNTLGIKLVIVHGTRPQTEEQLTFNKIDNHYLDGLRVTDQATLTHVKESIGVVRSKIEAVLSTTNTSVISGNFVTAQPLGVRNGTDFQYTGEVRKINSDAIHIALKNNTIVLLSPIGYSPTGEAFNLSAEDIATATAIQLQADKLLALVTGKGVQDSRRRLIRQLTPDEAEKILRSNRKLPTNIAWHLTGAVHACRNGVRRAHLIGHKLDGGLLQELFTRDGIGTMVTADTYDNTRQANIDDVIGIMQLLEPIEQEGVLIKRSRELLEIEIERFTVLERDGMIIGCGALYPTEEDTIAEVACIAIHKEYRAHKRGSELLKQLEQQAKESGVQQLYLLTTQTADWFKERGFQEIEINQLPVERQKLYNYDRNSKIFNKPVLS